MSAATPTFEVRVEPGAGSTTIVVSGELDSATHDQLAQALETEFGRQELEKVVLDLRAMTFVDSAGTRILIQAQREADRRGIALEVLSAPREVTALLRMAGVTERINVVGSPSTIADEEFLERIDMELERELTAPAQARAEVRDVFGSVADKAELATLVLLTSELVTNAVIHPRPSRDQRLGLRITAYPERMRIEVDDPGDGFDPEAPLEPTDTGGRGLMLVDTASAGWGAGSAPTPRGERFTVWFELGLAQPEARAAAR